MPLDNTEIVYRAVIQANDAEAALAATKCERRDIEGECGVALRPVMASTESSPSPLASPHWADYREMCSSGATGARHAGVQAGSRRARVAASWHHAADGNS